MRSKPGPEPEREATCPYMSLIFAGELESEAAERRKRRASIQDREIGDTVAKRAGSVSNVGEAHLRTAAPCEDASVADKVAFFEVATENRQTQKLASVMRAFAVTHTVKSIFIGEKKQQWVHKSFSKLVDCRNRLGLTTVTMTPL